MDPAHIPAETKVLLGLHDVFSTRLREDIVEVALQMAEEGDRFVDGVNLDPAWWPVDLVVNGRRLVDVVGGSYEADLPAHVVYLPTRYLLGEAYPGPGWWAEQAVEEDGKRLLLSCSCGDSGCGRLVARVTATDETVVWSELEHRPCCGTPIPDLTFVFARAQYEDALRDPKPAG